MPSSHVCAISLLIATLCAANSAPASTKPTSNVTIIRAATIIDGTGSAPYGPADVEIIGNKISRIGVNLKFSGAREIAGKGKTLTPGLIDCHTHLRTVPGAIFRNDSAAEVRSQQKRQLQAYLAAGVTTVLDAATPMGLFNEIKELETTTTIPRVAMLEPFITPKNGYFADAVARRSFYQDLTKPIENLSDIHERIDEVKDHRPVGLKTTVEFGFSPFAAFPVFNDEFLAEIRKEANAAKLPIFVHSESEEAFRIALKLKPYAFMHGGFFDAPASASIVQDIKASGAYVVSTLAIYKMMLLMWDQQLFEDPWVKMLVPAAQLQTARESSGEVVKLLAVQNKPWFTPEFVARLLSGFFLNQNTVSKNYQNSKVSLTAMYKAGVPIVMGSDAGNYPLFATFFHGVGSVFEVESLIDAGLPVSEAIRASTSRAAAMLKINGEVGVIAVGKVADLLLLNQDPMTAPHAFRDIDYIFKSGQPKHPTEWLQN